MKRLTLVTFFSIAACFAQPGLGGGGFTICKITDKYNNEINVLKDSLLKIRTFDIKDDTVYWETFLYQDMKRYKRKLRISPSNYHFIDNHYHNKRSLIYAIYEKDTMIIDVEIMPKNHLWRHDFISKLKIQQGYFSYKKQTNNLRKISSKINLDFLEDKNLVYQYYMSHFYRSFSNKKLNYAEKT